MMGALVAVLRKMAMIWHWHWRHAWRVLRGRCLGCGTSDHVFCFNNGNEIDKP